MTMKHMLDGLMQATKCRTHSHLAALTGLSQATLTRIHQGKQNELQLRLLDRVQSSTGVPIEHLFAWYRLPAGAVLGRITITGDAQ